jgi:hypothetical protein
MAIYPNDLYPHNVFFTNSEGVPIIVSDAIYSVYRYKDDNTIEMLIENEPMSIVDENEPTAWTAFITIPSDTAGQTLTIRVSAINLADERIVRESKIDINSIRGMKISFV